VIFILTASLPAQTIVDPARLSDDQKNFEPRSTDKPLHCEVMPIHPTLDFNFRLQSGYLMRVPMNQYEGSGHAWFVLERITPQEGNQQPVYLAARVRLPTVPAQNKNEIETGGGYYLGPGRYDVAWKLMDDSGRVCRKTFTVDAKPSHAERKVKVAMEPGTVAQFGGRRAPNAVRDKDDAAPLRVTVLLHAAPISPRRSRMTPRDRLMLMGILSSFLERVPVRNVRLTAFNLEQQRELYRQDHFQPGNMGELGQSINSMELALVDYHVLQNRGGHLDLLTDIINRELTEQSPSDVVLFLGPLARFDDKIHADDLERPQPAGPKFVYFQYRPPMRVQQAVLPDTIAKAVGKLKGKTFIIRTPGDFAKAIEQVEKK